MGEELFTLVIYSVYLPIYDKMRDLLSLPFGSWLRRARQKDEARYRQSERSLTLARVVMVL